MVTSADTLSLDGCDLLEDAPVANAPAGQTRPNTVDPAPPAIVEPTPPAQGPAETTATPTTVAETTLPALTPAETMASPQASTEEEPDDNSSKKGEPIDTAVQLTMPAANPDTGKDETLLAMENLLKEMGEGTEMEYNPGASTSSGPTYVPTPIKILRRTAACAVMPCHVPTRSKLVTPARKPPEAELPSKPGRFLAYIHLRRVE